MNMINWLQFITKPTSSVNKYFIQHKSICMSYGVFKALQVRTSDMFRDGRHSWEHTWTKLAFQASLVFGLIQQFKFLRKMRASQFLPSFLQNILKISQPGSKHFPQLKSRPSKVSASVYALRLVDGLELQEDIVILGLYLAKKSLQKDVYMVSQCLYRLITVTFLLAEKLTNDDHHSIESYSLLSSIPIKELIALQAIILEIMEFQLIYDEREINLFKRNELIQPTLSNSADQ